MRRTKILATLGPASREPAVIEKLIAAGVDAVRLSFSHGNHESHGETYRRLRQAEEAAGRPIGVLQDLQGPKVRLGVIAGKLEVPSGSRLVITTRAVTAEPGLIPTDYLHLPQDVAPGHTVLLDDGRLTAEVESVTETDVVCKILHGGVLSSCQAPRSACPR